MIRLKAGDPEAFSELFSRYQSGVTNYVYKLSGGNIALAEDIAQQVFLSFWLHREEYDLEKPITPLLLTMARNAWLNVAKREGLRKAHLVEKSAELTAEGDARAVAERDRRLEQRELTDSLERALSSLEPPLREVFILSRYHEMKYSEISEILGISVKTVEARLSRALHFLHDRLKEFLEK